MTSPPGGSESPDPAPQPRFLSLEEIRRFLPPVEGFRPLLDRVVQVAEPDEATRWSGAGELATVSNRHVDPARLDDEVPALLETVAAEATRSAHVAMRIVRLAGGGQVEAAADMLRMEAEHLAGSGRLADAEACIDRALQLARGFRDRRAALPFELAGARIARARGRLEEAEARYERALRMGVEGGSPDIALTAAIGLGNLDVDRGRWARAGERYAHAEQMMDASATGEDTGSDTLRPERWHLALNRSILARETGDLPRAHELLQEAERIAGELGDLSALPIVDNARGQLLLARGAGPAAVRILRRALEAASTPDARVTIGVNLAEALLAAGRHLEAGQVARQAEDVAVRGGVVSRLPEVYRILGEVLGAMGTTEAFLFHERALEIIRDHALPEVERARVLESYARLELVFGRTGEARAHTEGAREIRARLQNEGPDPADPLASGPISSTDYAPNSERTP